MPLATNHLPLPLMLEPWENKIRLAKYRQMTSPTGDTRAAE
jgi:hypothetical protein